MNTTKPEEILDSFLTYFVNLPDHGGKEVMKVMSELNYPSLKEIIEIIGKLKKDGYVWHDYSTELNPGRWEPQYTSTFEGRMFLRNGGYVKQKENEQLNETIADRNERRIVRNETWLLRGTWAAAIIGFLVLVWYIFQWYFPHYSEYPYQWIWEKTTTKKP